MYGLVVASILSAVPLCGQPKPVRVTVVVILATPHHTSVDPLLIDLAAEVRKRDESLTGFRVSSTEVRSIPVGGAATIPLVEKQVLRVKVERAKDAAGRICLTIKPPKLGEVTYACTCDKYFPVVTSYVTSKGEILIIAVMAKPCTLKK